MGLTEAQQYDRLYGIMKETRRNKRLMDLRGKIGKEWWQWLDWDEKRKCIVFQEYYSSTRRLDRKYKLHLKRYRHDKTRNSRFKERSVQRNENAGVAA